MFNCTPFHTIYAVLAGLICTTSSLKPDNSRYLCSKRLKIIYVHVLQIGKNRLHCASTR